MLNARHNRRMFCWLLRRTCGAGAVAPRGEIDAATGKVTFYWRKTKPGRRKRQR